MSKRIILTDREIEAIIEGLQELKYNALIEYPVVLAGRRFYDDIIERLAQGKQATKGEDNE